MTHSSEKEAPLQSYMDGNVRQWTKDAILGLPFTGSAYRAPDGTVVWIDPDELGADEAAVLALGEPAHILVTFRDHDRAVPRLAQRFNAKIWVPKGKGGSLVPDVEFDESTALPAGLKALSMPAMGYGEHALWTEAYGKRFAFVGDAVFNLEGTGFPSLVAKLAFHQRQGALRMKRAYRGGDNAQAPAQLQRLIDLKLDAVFLSHGHAVAENAEAALRGALGKA
jgi:glyoxylase-like metal-dependent hydrolase (beta-lactamase superfamily II)